MKEIRFEEKIWHIPKTKSKSGKTLYIDTVIRIKKRNNNFIKKM
ncbi:putative integrase domain protein [Orientia tsutsugamushi str. TA763]|nr:putative integrase domain protein [Orientia tsutsugamushi str. TA763]KJV71481.1 putative integrase domain protein [Orientia tsutsugamushi str. TA763]KJV75332.1 putative integrase domain protein [Orientia tsutsugamushi str. TA763]